MLNCILCSRQDSDLDGAQMLLLTKHSAAITQNVLFIYGRSRPAALDVSWTCCEQEAIKRLSRRPVHEYDDDEEDLWKLRRFSGESAAIARLHDEGQASLAPRQLDDYELERAMVTAVLFGMRCQCFILPRVRELHCNVIRQPAPCA